MKEIQPEHYGKGVEDYRAKAFSVYPKVCVRCGYKEVEEVLQVHHKDRNRKNRDISNLEVLCPTCHMVEHFKTKSGFWASGVIENTGGLHPPVVGL
jgi:5-methylcytosine-specific restriction endonuclease McrA